MIQKETLNAHECALIEDVLKCEGSFRLTDIEERLRTRQAQAWADEGSIAITYVSDFPLQRILNLWLIAGDLKTIMKNQSKVFQWAKDRGCNQAQLEGRKGWSKMLSEWSETGVIMRRGLT